MRHYTRQRQIVFDDLAFTVCPRSQWYNVLLIFERDGSLQQVYCNVAQPAQLTGSNLSWVDLDLDVVQLDGATATLDDVDEFQAHAAAFAYPAEVVAKAQQAADQLLELADRGAAPFCEWTLEEALQFYGTGEAGEWLLQHLGM